MVRASVLFKRCIVLGSPAGVVRGDVLLEDGVVRCIGTCEALGNVEVIDCEYSMVVTPCTRIAWLLPVRVDEGLTYREFGQLLAGLAGGEGFSEDYAAKAVSELTGLGVCEAVVTVPAGVNVDVIAGASGGVRLRFNVLASSSANMLDKAYRFARELGDKGLLAGLELVDASVAGGDSLKRAAGLSAELGARLYVHVSYSKRDVYESKKLHGLFPVERLERLGLLSDRTVLVGAGWISSWELGYVAKAGAAIVYSPAHDMLHCLGGHFPLYEALKSGVRVWLGLGFAAATLDPLSALLSGLLLQRYAYWDARLRAEDVVALAYTAAELFGSKPGLEVGREAYLTVYKLTPSSQAIAEEDPALALLRGGEAYYTIAGGELVFSRG